MVFRGCYMGDSPWMERGPRVGHLVCITWGVFFARLFSFEQWVENPIYVNQSISAYRDVVYCAMCLSVRSRWVDCIAVLCGGMPPRIG